MQSMKFMLVTSSFTWLSNPSRVQASWVNAFNWWEVKLKPLLFTGSSTGAVKGEKKKDREYAWECFTDNEVEERDTLGLQFSKGINNFMKIGFQPDLHALTRKHPPS